MYEYKPSSPGPGRTIKRSIKEWADELINVRLELIKNAMDIKKSEINQFR